MCCSSASLFVGTRPKAEENVRGAVVCYFIQTEQLGSSRSCYGWMKSNASTQEPNRQGNDRPACMCYRPAVSSRYIRFIAVSFPKENFRVRF
jgi:hypothetical protein